MRLLAERQDRDGGRRGSYMIQVHVTRECQYWPIFCVQEVSLSCHAWVGFYRGRWRRGGGTKSRWLCHMCASITRTLPITHTLSPDSYACMQKKIILIVFFLNWCLQKNKKINEILMSCRVECFLLGGPSSVFLDSIKEENTGGTD